MNRDTAMKQMKSFKSKAKKARAGGKKDLAKAFRSGARRLQRKLKASAPKVAPEGAAPAPQAG